MPGVSIIVPTRNEADNIDLLLERIFAVDYLREVEHEVIFVDDSSTDLTREKIRQWSARKPVRLVERDYGKGLASAVVAGAGQAAFDTALVMDADLSHPPEKIPEMIEPLLTAQCDMVIGSRYVEGGATPEWPRSRKIASKLATIPARLFTDVNDPMAGFFSTFTSRLKALRPDVPGFKIGLEVLAVGGDQLRVFEVPIVFHDRFEGFSKMNKRIILEYLKQVVQLSRIGTELFTPAVTTTMVGAGTVLNVLVFWALQRFGFSPLVAHLSSMTSAGVFLFVIMAVLWRKRDPAHRLNLDLAIGFIVVLVFSVSMQASVFYLFDRAFNFQRLAAFIPGALAGTGSFTLFSVVYLFSGLSTLPKRAQAKSVVIGSVAALIVLKLLYLGLPELMEQEAYYWNYAQHPDLSYLDHPPLAALLIWLGTGVFGTTEFGVRIGAFLSWFATAYFTYRLTSDIFHRTAAWGSVLLVSLLPLYFGTGFVITPDSTLHAAWAALIYFLYRSLIKGSSKAWLGVGISLGLGLLSKYTIVLLGPGIVCFLLIDKRARSWFLRPEPYGAVVLGLLLFAPVLIWNYQNDWISFLFQGEQRVSGRDFFTTHRLIAYMAMLLTPAGLLGLIYFLFGGNAFFKTQASYGSQDEKGAIHRSFLLLLLLIISPLLVFLFFSFSKEVKLNWTSPIWLALLPFLGCTVTLSCGELKSTILCFLHWLWKLSAVALVIGYCAFLHYATLGLPSVPFHADLFLMGWKNLAEEVELVADNVELNYGNRPLVVGMDPYQISSGLAFYRAKIHRGDKEKQRAVIEGTMGWHLFGWKGLMYEHWGVPEEYYGRDVIAIASSRIRVEYPYFQNRFLLMNNIHTIDATKNGKFVHRYYYRVIRNYRPARN
ncbi:MAG: glycosyltransferase family 39 protein [Desulfocapsaceae bacterium]